jgi:HK97 family phage prohead protease
MPEYKAAPAFTMGIEDRTVTGIFAVHGNVDEGGDKSHPGVFGDFTVGGRSRVVFLWQHDASQPPIAKIDRIFEVAKADLPPAVRLYAPDATGGTAVQRTYLETPRGNEVLAGLKAGAISEMSYAYQPTKWDFEEVEGARYPVIRNIYQSELLDASDVNWGMNPATSADGRKGQPLEIEHQTVLAAVDAHIKRYQALATLRAKEGRVLSDANRKRIADAIEALAGAKDALDALLAMSEPQKTEALKADPAVIQREIAKFMRLQAQLNGALTV